LIISSANSLKLMNQAGEVQNAKEMPQVLKGSKVLVVETNPLIASIRKERFQSWGLDAGSVASGVLMLATVDNLEDNQQYSKLKIEANLLKPWYTSVLMDTILKVLEVKRANAEYKPNNTEKVDALEFMAS